MFNSNYYVSSVPFEINNKGTRKKKIKKEVGVWRGVASPKSCAAFLISNLNTTRTFITVYWYHFINIV